ncbi:cysteine--tRNA ligase [Candidatus Saccharibacteria bacterium]|nr:MAG: cysteine--tRNA ligase [Candidatus Saccharibacteria bacterium]
MMQLYNTLSRTVEPFKALDSKNVRLYACGLTVYSQPHIGNWVAYIYWDLLVRTLTASDFAVTHVQNITDVGHLTSDEDAGEDKMLKGALREGLTAWEVAEKYIQIADHEAYELLGLRRPTHMPRATEYIEQQAEFVRALDEKGFTYTITDGIYFDTSKLKNYGELARLDIDGLRFGARVADTGKKNPTDFAVWKFSDPSEKRDMEWDNPLPGTPGKGFPGWHLECSVMAGELLGEQIDIHTGGIDHIPVHHTNEIAQTESLTKKRFSQFWVHGNHLKVNGTKISKSLGNGFTLQDITDRGYDLEAFKLLVLSKHYRTEGNFTWEILDAAQNRLNELRAWADLRHQPSTDTMPTELDELFRNTKSNILAALQNDLNTPLALAELGKLVSYMSNIPIPGVEGEHTEGMLAFIDSIFGLNLDGRPDITQQQKDLLTARQKARDTKDWAESDSLRDELKEQGIAIRDTDYGQQWSRIKD